MTAFSALNEASPRLISPPKATVATLLTVTGTPLRTTISVFLYRPTS